VTSDSGWRVAIWERRARGTLAARHERANERRELKIVPSSGAPRGAVWVPIGCLELSELRGTAGESQNTTWAQEPVRLQAISAESGNHPSCLPCRRSRVRIPSAALKKACICRLFLREQSACASASSRTDSGLAAGRSSAFQRKPPVCRPILLRPNPNPSARLQRSVFACCGRHPDSYFSGTILRTAPAGAIPTVAALGGQSGFSPETARSTSARSAATPSEPSHPEP
jgi:hypothetical protein